MSNDGSNQVPRSAEIVGAGLDSLATTRPSAFPFANNGAGRYADFFTIQDAMAQVCITRLVKEVVAKRIGLAGGDELTDLTRSEYQTEREDGVTASIGQLFLSRPTFAGGAGAIRKGARLSRRANPTANPPVPAATYVVTQDCPIGSTDLVPQTPVYIQATQTGAAGNNIDLYSAGTPLVFTWLDAPFDTTFTFGSSIEAAGGADSKGDPELRAEAYAYAVGQYGPTIGSVLAGALRGTGVRHAAVVEVTQTVNGITGAASPAAFTGVLVADESWGGGEVWVSTIQQALQDPENGFIGVGQSVVVSYPNNQATTVTCTVMLQDAAYLAFTGDITGNIQAAVQSYFDDRPDWYTYTIAGLRAAITKSDTRIRSCTTAAVLQASNGQPMPAPLPVDVPQSQQLFGSGIYHYFLISNGVQPTFIGPT